MMNEKELHKIMKICDDAGMPPMGKSLVMRECLINEKEMREKFL